MANVKAQPEADNRAEPTESLLGIQAFLAFIILIAVLIVTITVVIFSYISGLTRARYFIGRKGPVTLHDPGI